MPLIGIPGMGAGGTIPAGDTTGQQPVATFTAQGTSRPYSFPEAIEDLRKLFNMQAVQRPDVTLPQPVLPPPAQAGDLSRNYANPNTPGGLAYNRRVTLAQNIGNTIAQGVNYFEEKQARDIAYDYMRITQALNNPTPENQDLFYKIMFKDGIPGHGLTKRGKELQQALNFSLSGDDKSPNHVKKSKVYIRQMQDQQDQQEQALTSQKSQAARDQLNQITQSATAPPAAQMSMPQRPMNIAGMYQFPQPPVQATLAAQPQGQALPQGTQGITPAGAQAQLPQQAQAQPPAWKPSGPYANVLSQFPSTWQMSPEAQVQAQMIKAGLRPTGGVVTEQMVKAVTEMAKDDTRWAGIKAIVGEREADSIRRLAASKYASDRRLGAERLMADARKYSSRQSAGASIYRSNVLFQLGNQRQYINFQIQQNKSSIDAMNKTIRDATTTLNKTDASEEDKATARNTINFAQGKLNEFDFNAKQLQRQLNENAQAYFGAASGQGEPDLRTPPEPSGGAPQETLAPPESSDDRLLDDLFPEPE